MPDAEAEKRIGMRKNLKKVLGLDRSFFPLLQRINPGEGKMRIIKGLLNAGMEPDEELLCWCGENNVSSIENLTTEYPDVLRGSMIRMLELGEFRIWGTRYEADLDIQQPTRGSKAGWRQGG